MKFYCETCKKMHRDADFEETLECGFWERQNLGEMTEEDKKLVWKHIVCNKYYDYIFVKYKLSIPHILHPAVDFKKVN